MPANYRTKRNFVPVTLVDIIFRGIRIPQGCVRRKSSKTVRHRALITLRVQANIFSFFDGQDSKFEKRKGNRVPWRAKMSRVVVSMRLPL